MEFDKLFKRSKAGNKTRTIKGKRYDVAGEDMTQAEAKKFAAAQRKKTGKRHFIHQGDGGVMVLEGGMPKKRKKTTQKAATSRAKPKNKKLNPTLKAWNNLRSMQAAFCDGDTSEAAVKRAEDAYVKQATKGGKQTAATARKKAKKLKKCKN